MKIAVTGHRPDRINGQEYTIKEWLNKKIEEYNPDVCISGMAQGVDQMWAYSALGHNKDLWCVMPYRKTSYPMPVTYLLNLASRVIYMQEKYSKDCYFNRDKAMVDASDKLLVVWDGQENGGTYYTMKYAESVGKPMDILKIEPNLQNN